MSLVLEFLAEAATEVTAATEYYEGRVSGLGVRFRREIESACRAIRRDEIFYPLNTRKDAKIQRTIAA
jgi:hypothetical protein